MAQETSYNPPFWVIADENKDIVHVMHPVFGVMKAVFGEEHLARKALSLSQHANTESMLWQVWPAEISDPEVMDE